MSQHTKQYQDFFRDSEAGQLFIADLQSILHSEQSTAASSEDMQAAFAHIQRAKGVQMAITKVQNLITEVKKPT